LLYIVNNTGQTFLIRNWYIFFLGRKRKKVQLVEIIAWYFLILFIKTFLRLLFIWHCRKKWISSSSTLQVLQSLRCLGIFLYLHSSISNGWSLVLNLVKSSGGIKGGLWGLQPPTSSKSSTYFNISFSRLVNVTIWLLIEWFIIDLCDESKRKYKLISLYWINLQRGNYK
jgi:hypothetical protein